jgi:hypothetical protein
VERVLRNALAKLVAASSPDNCAFDRHNGIVFGEADPPFNFPQKS